MKPQSLAIVLLRTALASLIVVGLTGCQGDSGAAEQEPPTARRSPDSPEIRAVQYHAALWDVTC